VFGSTISGQLENQDEQKEHQQDGNTGQNKQKRIKSDQLKLCIFEP
jgi:hypothetical protein